jgi:hypothetical protein
MFCPHDLNPGEVYAVLPGPDRRRTFTPYAYRLTYRAPAEGTAGCVLLWEVAGGRMRYQIALERDEAGELRLHCTCADAVFRGETEGHVCKHVRGLLDIVLRGLTAPDVPLSA